MMPEWHQLDSSCTMSEQQESVKKKTLKSSSRSFLFSTGLFKCFINCQARCVTYGQICHRDLQNTFNNFDFKKFETLVSYIHILRLGRFIEVQNFEYQIFFYVSMMIFAYTRAYISYGVRVECS